MRIDLAVAQWQNGPEGFQALTASGTRVALVDAAADAGRYWLEGADGRRFEVSPRFEVYPEVVSVPALLVADEATIRVAVRVANDLGAMERELKSRASTLLIDLVLEEEWQRRRGNAPASQVCPVCQRHARRVERCGEIVPLFALHRGRGPDGAESADPCPGGGRSFEEALAISLFGLPIPATNEERIARIRAFTPEQLTRIVETGDRWSVPRQAMDEARALHVRWTELAPALEAVRHRADLGARAALRGAIDALARAPGLVAALRTALDTVPEDLAAVGQRAAALEAGPDLDAAARTPLRAPAPTSRHVQVRDLARTAAAYPHTRVEPGLLVDLLTGQAREASRRVREWLRTATPGDVERLAGPLRELEEAGASRPVVLVEIDRRERPAVTDDDPSTPTATATATATPTATPVRAEDLRRVRLPDGRWDLWHVAGSTPTRLQTVDAAPLGVAEIVPSAEHDPGGVLELLTRVYATRGIELTTKTRPNRDYKRK